jgi:hypothetical protein
LPGNFAYQQGKISDNILPEFICNNSLEKIMEKLPNLTPSENLDVDLIQQERNRYVEF